MFNINDYLEPITCEFSIGKINSKVPIDYQDMKFNGKIERLRISSIFDKLDLSNIDCLRLEYYDQGINTIKNHILPKNLKELYCNDCNIINLPELPNKLITLECSYNSISKLPKLPDSLQELLCNHNKLIEFPNIPKSLSVLHISDNKIDGISDYIFDSNIKILNLSNNNIDSIIGVPNKCKYLYCENLPLIKYGLIPNDVKVYHTIHRILHDFLVNDGDISKMIITINDKENCDYDSNYFPKFKRVN